MQRGPERSNIALRAPLVANVSLGIIGIPVFHSCNPAAQDMLNR